MTRSPFPIMLLPQPFALWSELAARMGETLLASAQVIGHRTGRMALAGPLPSASDREEFLLMGREKVDAATHSAAAMGRHWLGSGMGRGLGERVWADWMAVARAAFACLASRSPGEAAGHWRQLADAMARLAASLAELGSVGAQLADRGLKPIHAAATANARRLSAG